MRSQAARSRTSVEMSEFRLALTVVEFEAPYVVLAAINARVLSQVGPHALPVTSSRLVRNPTHVFDVRRPMGLVPRPRALSAPRLQPVPSGAPSVVVLPRPKFAASATALFGGRHTGHCCGNLRHFLYPRAVLPRLPRIKSSLHHFNASGAMRRAAGAGLLPGGAPCAPIAPQIIAGRNRRHSPAQRRATGGALRERTEPSRRPPPVEPLTPTERGSWSPAPWRRRRRRPAPRRARRRRPAPGARPRLSCAPGGRRRRTAPTTR
jgi:hypothetical protein